MGKWADEFREGQDSAKLKSGGDAILRALMAGIAIVAAWFAPFPMWAKVLLFFAVMFIIGIVVQLVSKARA